VAVGRFRHNLDVSTLEQALQSTPNDLVIIRQQNSNRHVCFLSSQECSSRQSVVAPNRRGGARTPTPVKLRDIYGSLFFARRKGG
jgi:hypothetical protein